ncbi:MAG: hypothetical protein GY863_01075 [bacterium]|nr:hypothetical protein [bacterium]
MRRAALFLLVLIMPAVSYSQNIQKRPVSKVKFSDIIFESLERSYILPLGGDYNKFIHDDRKVNNETYENVLLEGNIVPAYSMFNIESSKDRKRGITNLWSNYILFTPKIVLRMYTTDSAPVRTPSFMPRITYYYWKRSEKDVSEYKYVSFMVSHFSNGSIGNFLNPDNTININDGSFSTNYVEIAYNWASYNKSESSDRDWLNWFKIGFETHFRILNTSDELKVKNYRYGFNRINIAFRHTFDTRLNLFELTPKFTWIADKVLDHESIFTKDNFITSLTLSFGWKKFEDIRFFINSYWGPDYYNINYFKYRNIPIRVGISTNPSTLLK